MTTYTPDAQRHLDEYLHNLRSQLAATPHVDAAEIEADIREHIEAALADHAGAIDRPALEHVLASLGQPTDWVRDAGEKSSGISPAEIMANVKTHAKQAVRYAVGGPESYRLCYLAFFVFWFSWFIVVCAQDEDAVPFGFFGTAISFFLARAAVTFHGKFKLSMAQKWILAPCLMAIYLPLAGTLVLGPPIGIPAAYYASMHDQESMIRRYGYDIKRSEAAIEKLNEDLDDALVDESLSRVERYQEMIDDHRDDITDDLERIEKIRDDLKLWPISNRIPSVIGLIATAWGGWWFLVGLVSSLKPSWVRGIFRPYAEWFRGGWALAMCVTGLVLLSLGLWLITPELSVYNVPYL